MPEAEALLGTPLWPLVGCVTHSRNAPPLSKLLVRVVWSGVVGVFGAKNADMTAVTALTTRGLYLIPIYISPYFFKKYGHYGQKGPPDIRKPPPGRPHAMVVSGRFAVAMPAREAREYA